MQALGSLTNTFVLLPLFTAQGPSLLSPRIQEQQEHGHPAQTVSAPEERVDVSSPISPLPPRGCERKASGSTAQPAPSPQLSSLPALLRFASSGNCCPSAPTGCCGPGTTWGYAGRRKHYPDLTRHSWVLQTSFSRIERKGSLSCRDER